MSKYPAFLTKELDKTLDDFPNVPSRTLAKRIYKKHSKFFDNVEQVRSAIRRRRGNSGNKNASHPRPNQPAGWVPQIPPSQITEWVPHIIDGPERIAVLSDVHIPYHNEQVLQQWLEDAYEYEPSTILLNGDIFDFYRLSRFEKDPSKRDTSFELDAVHDFLDWLQYNFEADIIWKDGNHDERWRKYLYNHAPEFATLNQFELCEILDLEDRNITYVTDKRIILAGQLPILHGHEMAGSSTINPAKSMFNKMNSSAIQAHCHRSSEYLERNVFGDWICCYSVGCVCELTPEFSRINKWNHGYAFVEIDSSGNFEVNNVVLN